MYHLMIIPFHHSVKTVTVYLTLIQYQNIYLLIQSLKRMLPDVSLLLPLMPLAFPIQL